MNIKDAYVHVGPSGTNEKALLKDFAITAALITLTRAILNDAGTGDKTETITIPTWNQSTTGNAATATKLALSITLSLTGSVTGSASFDGSGNFSIATTTNHTHDYLHSVQTSGALTTVSWAIETAKTVRRGFIYNTSGTEWSYLFGLSSSNTTIGEVTNNATYGAILKMGYSDRYLRILRVHSGKWYKPDNTQAALGSTEGVDWEKIHAGYADSAGSVSWTNVTGKPSLYNQSESDARFVLKAGDTMSGALTVPSLSVTGSATFSQAINGSILGNAATASRLQNARTISLTGSVTGSGTFDGSGNLSIATTTNHNHNSSYMTACALFTGASAATSATASLTNGNVYLNATKTINGTATNVGSIKISGSTGISVTTDANGHITVTGTTSYLRAGATGATANVTSATSNPYLALVEGTTQSSQVQLFASTGISISANNGVITFTNTSTNSHTYTSTWTAKTDNVNYPIAFSPNATPTTSGNGYNTGFTFNPGTKTFNNNGCRLQYDSTNKVLKFIFD